MIVLRVSNDRNEGCTNVGRTGWHIDGSFQPAPFSHSVYHIVSCPRSGATVFAGLTEILEGLDDEKRRYWDRLWMLSDRRDKSSRPLVYRHPETEKPGMQVQRIIERILSQVGLRLYCSDVLPPGHDLRVHPGQGHGGGEGAERPGGHERPPANPPRVCKGREMSCRTVGAFPWKDCASFSGRRRGAVRAQLGAGGLHHLGQPGAGPRGPPGHAETRVRGRAQGHAQGHGQGEEGAAEVGHCTVCEREDIDLCMYICISVYTA